MCSEIRRPSDMIYFVAVGFASLSLISLPNTPLLTFFHPHWSTTGNFGLLPFDVCAAAYINPCPQPQTQSGPLKWSFCICPIMLLQNLNSGVVVFIYCHFQADFRLIIPRKQKRYSIRSVVTEFIAGVLIYFPLRTDFFLL